MLQFLLTICDEKYYSRIEYLYNHFHKDMFRFAKSKFRIMNSCNPHIDAEDAVQRAFLRISKYIHNIKFPAPDKELKSYCFSVVWHEVIRVLEENKKYLEFREELFEDDGYDIVEDIVSDIDLHMMYDEVVKAIANLDEIYSMTLLLRYEKGMKPDEIAETMGISNKTVYTRLSRGKKLLREALKGAKYGQ